MDKNTITGLVLIAYIIGRIQFSEPSERGTDSCTATKYYDSIAVVQQQQEAA